MADSDDPKVVRLDSHRKKKAEDDFFKGRQPIEHLLDLRGKRVHYSPMVAGKRGKVRMGIVLGDVTSGTVKPIGALVFEQAQWEEFKSAGDRMMRAHLDLLKSKEKTNS
jgi:hypothetical protein